jgi:hypothetical protein
MGTNGIVECNFQSKNEHRTLPSRTAYRGKPSMVARGCWLLEIEERRTLPARTAYRGKP